MVAYSPYVHSKNLADLGDNAQRSNRHAGGQKVANALYYTLLGTVQGIGSIELVATPLIGGFHLRPGNGIGIAPLSCTIQRLDPVDEWQLYYAAG